MRRDRAADLPAPGSPPSNRFRSGKPMRTGLPSSSMPSEMGSHSDPVGTGHGGAGAERASRQMMENWARAALAGSRSTRTSRAPMVAARVAPAASIFLAREPGGQCAAGPVRRRASFRYASTLRDLAVAADHPAADEDTVEPAPGGLVPQLLGQAGGETRGAPQHDGRQPR